MKRVRRSFSSPIQGDYDYANSPRKLDDEALSSLVQKLRDGDDSVKHSIIEGHMRLAMSIVAEFATPFRADDLVGEALLGLTQAVEWSGPHTIDGVDHPSRLHDNNITPYIASTIRRFLRDFISTDRSVFMPGRTFRAKAAAGEINPDGDNVDAAIVGVVRLQLLVIAEDPRAEGDGDGVPDRPHLNTPFTVPQARQEEPSLEFSDALTLAVRTEDERRVIELRKQGFKYREIAEQIGLSLPRIGQLNAAVEERFNALYACG